MSSLKFLLVTGSLIDKSTFSPQDKYLDYVATVAIYF